MTKKHIRPCPLMNGDPCCLNVEQVDGIEVGGSCGACGNPINVEYSKGGHVRSRAKAKARCPLLPS
ncbi:hypothetical protein [Salidesulfovibrio onnuriiensis]|uniref:hypothetical protein n=1 Tax=Salidesulfovibrio onnuriiensis TaxID=2583823 RepID=UPI0011C714A8|nr:hypothetical protein [Salidesulfovibrio onnuriiensis]